MRMIQKMTTAVGPDRSRLLDAGILVAGASLGVAVAHLTARPDYPYPSELRAVDQIGGAAAYGVSVAFLGLLASRCKLHNRRDSLRMGEWLGIAAAALILSGVLVECLAPGLLGPWLFARCLVLCLVWVAAVGLLLTKPFTRHRPGRRTASHGTELGGLLLCAMTVPFIAWQYAHELTYL
jgi:hypothetical protein